LQNLATDILACEARIAANRRLAGLLSRGRETEALRRERLVVKADTVLRQLELLSLLWDGEDEKAGFRPDQPRHPRGSGRISGRWSGGAGTIIDPADPAAAIIVDPADPAATIIITPAGGPPPPKGHHYVPQALIRRLNLTPEARKLLMNATTGELEKGKNRYDADHRRYNAALKRHLERFLRESGIGDRPMTADEAQRLLRSIWRSKDPDIRPFNRRLQRSALRVKLYKVAKFIWRQALTILSRGRIK